MNNNWIWLPEKNYPENQETVCSYFVDKDDVNYTVAEFKKEYKFEKTVKSAKLSFSGDTAFQLYLNDEIIATGPASVGGDFIENDKPQDKYYYSEKTVFPDSNCLNFFARVQMFPSQCYYFSKCHGGFLLEAIITFEDGTEEKISTDESWLSRLNTAYNAPCSFDNNSEEHQFVSAQKTDDIWLAEKSMIPVCEEKEIFPEGCEIELSCGEEKEVVLELDKIYAGYVHIKAETSEKVVCDVMCRELEEETNFSKTVFVKDGEYREFDLRSAGNIIVKAKNNGEKSAKLTVSFITTNYPVTEEATTTTSNENFNLILEVCKHTLKYCRQTIHFDSPRHCEPLACTGDYYIESLMTMFSFGDMRLAEFDVERMGQLLKQHDGRMFHTTYSLIWVRMLYDIYMAAGNKELLISCEPALKLLLDRFETYIGDNGIIDNPPDYMFVDWIYIDEISLHHPPKALGQTSLNMFYFGALDYAEKIFNLLGDTENAKKCLEKRLKLKEAVNSILFDKEKGIYFEGLNTPTQEDKIYHYMPQNTDKRYYLKQSNILAAYVGICDEDLACELIEKIMTDEIEGGYQPYFAHYLLEAIYKYDLREKYTLDVIKRWEEPVKECSKGLAEGFILPEPSYSFDHSHAWGGTPLYSLPKALMGLEILEAGMKKIRINPSLLSLEFANVELLTPFGKVVCEMKENEEIKITHPDEVEVIFH